MFKLAKPIFLHCQTPTHVGSGSDLGIIDLPIQRERHTQFPKFESSSFKGALRQRFEEVYPSSDTANRVKVHLAFGYDDAGEEANVKAEFAGKDKQKFEQQYAGALGFTDARLLFFPVKSMRGVFALVTCPYILEKLAEELILTKNSDATWIAKVDTLKTALTNLQVSNLEASATEGFCYTNSTELKISGQNAVVLEEYAFTVKADFTELADLIGAIKEIVNVNANKIVILHNDDFADFVTLHTEVITRNKIGENGVVVGGALFSEEFLPAESILYALIMASPIFQVKESDFSDKDSLKEASNVIKFLTDTIADADKAKGIFQIGGNATLGKGIVKFHF